MLELLWQVGILSAVLVFGAKIGLASGFAGFSKKAAALLAAGYGLGILALSFLVSGHTDVVYTLVYQYNFLIFLAMSVIIIYAGLHTLHEWKVHQKNHASATCAAMIAPCPCCFGAVIAAIVLATPMIGASAMVIGQYAAVALAVTIGIFYLGSGLIVKVLKKPYPILLGNFMLFVGLYFLASAIVIPNISTVLASKFHPLNIPSVNTFIYACIVAVALLTIGFYSSRKYSSLAH